MATTKKALAMADELVSEIKQRKLVLGLDASVTFDTDQNPLVKIGTGAAGAKGALVKIMPIDVPHAKDILGLQSAVYTPHVIKVAFEAITVNGGGADVDPNTWVEKLTILGMLVKRGTRVELYESAAADSPDADDMVEAKLKATFEPSTQYPMISNQ